MLNKLQEFFVKQFLLVYVKGFLDKFPLNERKTMLGLFLLAIGQILSLFPQYSNYLNPIISFVNNFEYTKITDAGLVSLISGFIISLVGLFHKDLKKLDQKVNGLPVAKNK